MHESDYLGKASEQLTKSAMHASGGKCYVVCTCGLFKQGGPGPSALQGQQEGQVKEKGRAQSHNAVSSRAL
jgi:hypothetical protein